MNEPEIKVDETEAIRQEIAQIEVVVEDPPLPKLDIQERVLYRIHRRLDYAGGYIEMGSLHDLQRCGRKALNALLATGAITLAKGPPLIALPGWTRRGDRLAKLGITTVAQLLGTDNETVATHLRMKPQTVQKWQNEARGWLEVSVRQG